MYINKNNDGSVGGKRVYGRLQSFQHKIFLFNER